MRKKLTIIATTVALGLAFYIGAALVLLGEMKAPDNTDMFDIEL